MNWLNSLLGNLLKPDNSKERNEEVIRLYEQAEQLAAEQKHKEAIAAYELAFGKIEKSESKDDVSRKQLFANKLVRIFEKIGELDQARRYVEYLDPDNTILRQILTLEEHDELRKRKGSSDWNFNNRQNPPPAPPPPAKKGREHDHTGDKKLTELPGGLTTPVIIARKCQNLTKIGEGLTVRRLVLDDCPSLEQLPAQLRCFELTAHNGQFSSLPADLNVQSRLDLTNCIHLQELPEGLKVGALILSGCEFLKSLPEGIELNFLNISGCASLEQWPQKGSLRFGNLVARDCVSLRSLPEWLGPLTNLDLRGCAGIDSLPEGLIVNGWIDIQGTRVTALPTSLLGAQIMWRGVEVDERIAFRPETISAQEVLAERNLERRRVLLDRIGNERFMLEAQPEVLDRDKDKGGERQLFKIAFENDEDLVCVSFYCPSTGRRYLTRVPPTTKTCKQAVAWMAGFDKPSDYVLVDET